MNLEELTREVQAMASRLNVRDPFHDQAIIELARVLELLGTFDPCRWQAEPDEAMQWAWVDGIGCPGELRKFSDGWNFWIIGGSCWVPLAGRRVAKILRPKGD